MVHKGKFSTFDHLQHMENQPLLNTILHTLHNHYGFSANAVNSVPVGYFEYMRTTEIVYADGQRMELFWHRDIEDDDNRLWTFHQLWIQNHTALEIGLAVNPDVPYSTVDALITLFDVFPDIDTEDEIEITDAERWGQFMVDHIDAYIERGENIVNGMEDVDDEQTE